MLLILGMALFAVLIGLGTWQVQRLHWKEGLLQTIEQRTHSAPRPLAELEKQFAATGDVDYTPVTVTGTFLHLGERHFFATWEGASGFDVFTPLQLDDGRFVLVNRGFVPYDLKDAAKRPQGEVAGKVTITGLARNPLAGKPSMMLPDNDVQKNIFYWKDRDAMAASAGLPAGAGLVPFFIDADKTPNPGGLPVGGVTIIDLPNSHLQYAVTWYGLAAALAGVLLFRLRRPAKAG
ncbi:SURF1 family protein [Mesorhizobium sp. M4B.F.Ca.ET.215.01.1.1]|nr:SURF1 family protein [Mesorhizobium sp. M4B.F.Ca.ET.013.02.1.1]RVD42530.1 SURF1 family protein [Mesorhizobium sp. M4B.F.Ca.ET.019.03.1.1]RWF67088.1 MAG: SURF1 family protein [Mesorhizobium sp.]TGQ18979.1 SURF1 family protein [Mesorhizobium sp. M4B.F.Ca.ET.215.01.1.1]TGQ40592.1 SURF1 family protein [Mesorhizobium sp. M4B.F.Ca.ET.214.01.1.1]TGQ49404.1 SURF1 family protein [Mesorhizobium sp. M00.F.Ca.ET.220.01.1.1]TGQ60649.1 SURF1 family protein [Mesorhizobium sp. M4B.F.Ca.ET.211.01.1.1]TGR0